MDKIKQVFSHDKHADNSGHSSTHTGPHSTTQTPTTSAAGDRTTVGHESAAEKVEDKIGARSTHDSTSASRTDPLEPSSGARTGPTGTTGTTTTGSTGASGAIHNAEAHVREHAQPPAHHHNQPTRDGLLDEAGAKAATHDHQHLAPVTHETRQKHEIEEVERQREVDRHVHHVQHHVQPVLDTQHQAEQQRENVVQPTEIKERHVATAEDKAQFASLATGHDEVRDLGKEKVIVDKGEKVHENTHHHVHHVVQPEINRDVHEHQRIHTTVPIHQTVEEAPIVHESVAHEPLQMKDFVANGGDLKSTLKHDAELLNRGECERTVDGPGETLTQSLGLTGGNSSSTTTGATEQRAL
ncbi:hypothetical protein JCM9279_003630 [Rhodotorula babjevae]